MKITLVNSFPNKEIIELADSINKDYFSDLDEAVGLFQSNEFFTFNKGKYAIMIPCRDVIVTSGLHSFLQPLRHIKIGNKHLVCFQKNIHKHPDLQKIIIHELRHIEQYSKYPTAFHRSQLIAILFNDRWPPPTEKDADDFVHNPSNRKHMWVENVKAIIKDYREEFKCLYSDFQRQKENKSPVGYIKLPNGECTKTVVKNNNELEYYLHIFSKANIFNHNQDNKR